MFFKLFDRIQTAKIMRMNAYDKAAKSEKNRAAGDNTETKASSKDACDNKAATKPEGKANDTSSKPEGEINNAKPVGEADMSMGPHIKDKEPGVIDFGCGVKIDTHKMNGPSVDPTVFQAATQNGLSNNAYLDYLSNPVNTAPGPINGVTNTPPPGFGRHKVDQPAKPKNEVKKADKDNVNVDLDNINIESNPPKPPKEWPNSVNSPLPQAGPVETPPNVSVFDNSAVTSRQNCRYLKDIEKLALDCGVQIQMLARLGSNGEDCGLISCIVYTPESPKPNPYKGFTIDTGMIIDKRAKVFPGIVQYGFEDMPSYPVLIPDPNNKENGKGKNVLNEQLFKNIFTGGVKMLTDMRPMYTPEYMELNKRVALITMPTQHMNKDTRKATQDRLMKAMKAGVFETALKEDPGSRFMFKPNGYNKKDSTFVLTNVGVPYAFCGQVCSTKPIEIVFGFDKDNNPITTYNYPNQ